MIKTFFKAFVIPSFAVNFIVSLALLFSFQAHSQNLIAAKVNNKVITSFELQDRYNFILAVSGMKVKNKEERNILLSQVLDKMIDEELIRQEAESLKIVVEKAELDDAIEMVALQRKQKLAQLKHFFESRKLSFDNYLKQFESEILWSKIMSETLRSKVKITDLEVNEFFEQHDFATNVKKFLLAEVVIAPSENAQKLSEKLFDELKSGADFKVIVQQFSSAPSRENNGEIGFVAQSDINKKIYEAISKLNKGGYSAPILLDDGYHIFKLLDKKIENNVSEKDLNVARNQIFQLKLQNLAKGYLMEMRKKSFIEKSDLRDF